MVAPARMTIERRTPDTAVVAWVDVNWPWHESVVV